MATPTMVDLDRASPLLEKRMRAVFRWLPQALAGEEEAVHQMRVAGRRLRVALALLARKPKKVQEQVGLVHDNRVLAAWL